MMKKQEYIKPTMRVVELKQPTHLLAGSPFGTDVKQGQDADDDYETL